MTAPTHEPFFIGWSGRLPRELVRFYVGVGLALVVALGGLGLLLGGAIQDPGRNLFATSSNQTTVRPEGWMGDQTFSGSLTLAPYPVLHVAGANGGVARSMLLSGSGKRGVDTQETARRVIAEGGLLRRGDIDMLVVDEAPKAAPDAATPPAPQRLGRWRSVGEICDGKCYPGGMTPGFGLAHRACAAVCLIGDVPAIFVTAEPLAGASFLLIAGPDGAAPGAWIRSLIARPVELEGEIERVGTMLIFKVEPEKARLL